MLIVGIAGGSGCGKTTFAKKVLHRVNDPSVAILHQDSYYLPSPPTHLRIHGECNFDHPDAFDWPLLKSHLQALKAGQAIEVPLYDFTLSKRMPETQKVGPCKVIILEGILALWDPELRDLFDLKVFMNVEADIRFIRRFHRDAKDRGRSLDSIIRQYYDTVRPMYRTHLEPTRQFADFVVGEETDIAADVLAARVKAYLQ